MEPILACGYFKILYSNIADRNTRFGMTLDSGYAVLPYFTLLIQVLYYTKVVISDRRPLDCFNMTQGTIPRQSQVPRGDKVTGKVPNVIGKVLKVMTYLER